MDEELDAMSVDHPQQEGSVLLNLDAVFGQVDIPLYEPYVLSVCLILKLVKVVLSCIKILIFLPDDIDN